MISSTFQGPAAGSRGADELGPEKPAAESAPQSAAAGGGVTVSDNAPQLQAAAPSMESHAGRKPI